MKTINCINCKFWIELPLKRENIYAQTGQCSRYAPREISGVGTGYNSKLWPEVAAGDWCGEYIENKGGDAQ